MSVTADTAIERRRSHRRSIGQALAFDRIGAVYVWIAMIIVFSIWAPHTFPTLATVKQLVNTYAITGIAALAVTIPLCARVFDLSFGYIINLCGIVVAYLVVHGYGLVAAVALALVVGLAMGVVNAFVVVVMRIDSFIGTLATGALIQALVLLITNDAPINDIRLTQGFAKISQTSIDGWTLPVFYLIGVTVLVWYLLEHTATGRRLYATGFNADAARLAGVRVSRLRFGSLLASGLLAGAAGILLASTVGSGSPEVGSAYLLPVFAAAFLGATQLKRGRFNAGGTIIAVLLLGTGVVGLGLVGAHAWAQQMFVGVVLIASLAVTGVQRRGAAGMRGRLRLALGRSETPDVAPVAESKESTDNPSKEASSR